jgi:hypothetical protein
VLENGSPVYLGLDDPSGDRVLQLGIIAGITRDRCTIEFENSGLPLAAGDELDIYYHQIKDFVRRRVRVDERSKDGPLSRLVMKFIGGVVSAETRQEHRVSTIDAGLSATLDTEDGCRLQDISMSGLGLISSRKHSIGETLDVTIRFEDDEFIGRAVVQSVQQLDGDRTRYGFRGTFDTKGGDPLRTGLMRMALGIHRQRLRRIAGSA